MRATLPLALLLLVSSCATYTQLTPPERAGIERTLLDDPEKFLRVSFHLTPFFGDKKKRLLTDVPPELVRLMSHPDGTPVNPGPVLDTLPAGTRARIIAIEFPTMIAVSARELFTPRDRAWVIVQIDGQPLPAVMVMPSHFRTQAEFLGELERYLSAHDPSAQVNELNPRFQDAVRTKSIALDMTAAALEMAWGYPQRKIITYEQGARKEEWIYVDRLRVAYLLDGRVTRWEP